MIRSTFRCSLTILLLLLFLHFVFNANYSRFVDWNESIARARARTRLPIFSVDPLRVLSRPTAKWRKRRKKRNKNKTTDVVNTVSGHTRACIVTYFLFRVIVSSIWSRCFCSIDFTRYFRLYSSHISRFFLHTLLPEAWTRDVCVCTTFSIYLLLLIGIKERSLRLKCHTIYSTCAWIYRTIGSENKLYTQ